MVAKFLIPKLCAALKRENPDYSNYDIREIVEKDCIEIWQKATIRDALPDEYKEKMRQEQARMSHTRYETGSEQASEFAPFDESGNNRQDSNLANSSSFGPVEDVSDSDSEDFDRMNRGQDVMTESQKIKKLEQRLNESEEERSLLRQEIKDLKTTVNVLKEKDTPELLKELQEKFANAPGLIVANKLQKDMYLFYFVKITV